MSNWKKKFKKIKYLLTNFPSLWLLHYTPHSICHKLANDMAVLYGTVAPSTFILSAKKQHSSFQKKVTVFQKFCFTIKVLKRFEISSDCYIKAKGSLKRRAIWKSIVLFFRRPVTGFKMKPLKKAFSCVKTKANSNFAVKLAERSNSSVFVYLMNHLFQASVLFNMWQWNL